MRDALLASPGTALLATLLTAALLTAALLPLVMRVSLRYGLLVPPAPRKVHRRPISQLGGIAIYCGFCAALLLSLFWTTQSPRLDRSPYEELRIGLLFAGTSLVFVVMLIDDLRDLRPGIKLFWQIVAALIAVGPYLWQQQLVGPRDEASGIILTAFNVPLLDAPIHLHNISPLLAIAATVFWIVGMMNTVNLLDGLDGLAAGVVGIAAAILCAHALRLGQTTIALLPIALLGACLGFLPYNFNPARIFMGDSGAMVLGYLLAVSAIIGGAKLATALLVLGVPILDVAYLIVARRLRGDRIATPGRDHLHHRLLDMGYSQRQIVAFYYTLSLLFGSLGLLPSDQNPALRLLKFGGLVLLAALLGVLLLYLARHQTSRTARS
jgi:UDP-GlcNAc:undecaprenyl-phosphate/decaprenyl-phosphate GlcNAc-1-phosphate transferase